MATTTDYDLIKVERIRRVLELQASKGKARYFEIFVDDLKVVPKTNDLAEFDSFEDFLTSDTEKVKILLYSTSPTSPRHQVHEFLLQPPVKPEPVQQSLQGFDIDQRINERVAIERERWETEQLKKELSDAKEKLSEAEDYIDKLQGMLDEAKGQKQQKESLGEITSLVKDVIPHFLTGNTAAKGQLSGSPETETEVTFTKKNAPEQSEQSDKERYLMVLKGMEEAFDDDQLHTVMSIVANLSEEPQNIIPVAQLLNIDTKNEN